MTVSGFDRAGETRLEAQTNQSSLTAQEYSAQVDHVNSDGSGWAAVSRVVEILLTGAFVLGLTVVSGGVLAAGQFRSIGISGTEAVAAMPRTELLARGADQVIP